MAEEGSSVFPCLWLRGILPSCLTLIPPEHEPKDDLDVYHYTHTDQDIYKWGSGVYYGDASGGKNTDYKALRRVGCSVVQCDSQGQLLYACYFNLPGIIQTVARGELLALVQLIRMADPLTNIEYITDNLGVCNTFNKGPANAQYSMNADLYNELYKLTIDKAIVLQVRWMPSHLTVNDPLPPDVSTVDVLSNNQADIYMLARLRTCIKLMIVFPVM